ncbi:hypothetical protein AS200_43880 [Streptomyces sp. CdTB01]|nr:hypothetical protein AS200_43880 [Streptomyces sp. CdTB01]
MLLGPCPPGLALRCPCLTFGVLALWTVGDRLLSLRSALTRSPAPVVLPNVVAGVMIAVAFTEAVRLTW